jgi:iron-sulfur cluster assembly protein
MLVEQTQNETTTEFITLTPTAVQAVRDLMEQRNLDDYALRIYISGGGCSGFQYGMALDNNFRESDLTSEFDGVKVLVDEVSINYLRGATVDYVNDVMSSGFKIENPNALASCGCGNSFRTSEDPNSSGSAGGCHC